MILEFSPDLLPDALYSVAFSTKFIQISLDLITPKRLNTASARSQTLLETGACLNLQINLAQCVEGEEEITEVFKKHLVDRTITLMLPEIQRAIGNERLLREMIIGALNLMTAQRYNGYLQLVEVVD